MTHAHITSWAIMIILFIVNLVYIKKGKPAKGLKMALRVFYLLVIGTGIQLLTLLSSITGQYILKTVLGVLVIGFMEMLLARSAKGKSTAIFWALFIVAVLYIVHLGFALPLGLPLGK